MATDGEQAIRGGRRVLVVDDDALNRRAAEVLLGRHLLEVVTVSDGRAALERVAAETFDLILLDDRMAPPDGPAVAAEIRRREQVAGSPRIPIIAITASVLPEDAERLLAAGMDEVLSKPLLAAELDAALRRWLGSVD
ncbi:MAG: response regulator [Chloroflexota bacterium]